MIAIVGGGVAGLACAYELCRRGLGAHVDLYEALPQVGGNVRNARVNGHPTPFGAVQVWRWYHFFLHMCRDVDPTLFPSDAPEQQWAPFYVQTRDGAYEPKDAVHVWQRMSWHERAAAVRLVPYALPRPTSFYLPSDNHDAEKSVAQVLGTDVPELRHQVKTLLESYTYPSIEQFPAASVVALASRSGAELQAAEALTRFPDTMHRWLRQRGVRIHTQTRVLSIHTNNDGACTLLPDGGERVHAQKVVLCTPWGVVRQNVVHASIDYTSIATVAVRLDVAFFASRPPWSAVFEEPIDAQPFQVLSFVNAHRELHDRRGIVLLYCRIPREWTLTSEQWNLLLDAHWPDFFGSYRPQAIEAIEYFPYTMPLATKDMKRKIAAAQGVHNVYFAGHYLATMPSLEGACFSGIWAATRLASPRDGMEALRTETHWIDAMQFARRLQPFLLVLVLVIVVASLAGLIVYMATRRRPPQSSAHDRATPI